MNINKLKAKLVENGLNVEKLAICLGINRASLYKKLNKSDRITIGEAMKIKAFLNLTDEEAIEIFFTNQVAFCAITALGQSPKAYDGGKV